MGPRPAADTPSLLCAAGSLLREHCASELFGASIPHAAIKLVAPVMHPQQEKRNCLHDRLPPIPA
jgi:hypothetical protein